MSAVEIEEAVSELELPRIVYERGTEFSGGKDSVVETNIFPSVPANTYTDRMSNNVVFSYNSLRITRVYISTYPKKVT